MSNAFRDRITFVVRLTLGRKKSAETGEDQITGTVNCLETRGGGDVNGFGSLKKAILENIAVHRGGSEDK